MVRHTVKYFTLTFVLVCCSTEVRANPDAKDILGKAVSSVTNAQTLYYEGTRSSSRGEMPQKYFLKNADGTNYIRAESSGTFSGTAVSTKFIKNPDGIWEVNADQAIDVSKAFTPDQLLGVYPFYRFIMSGQYPYELGISEEKIGGVKCFVVKGSLPASPDTNGPDIAKEFTYAISKTDGSLRSLHEITFGNRALDIKFEKFELNSPLSSEVFGLPPDLKRTSAPNFRGFMDLRTAEVNKLVKSPQFKVVSQAGNQKKWLTRTILLSLIVVPIGVFAYRFKAIKR